MIDQSEVIKLVRCKAPCVPMPCCDVHSACVEVHRRAGDHAFVVADNSLAKSILNWQPTRSIEEICISGWNWQQKNPNGYRN